MDTFLHKLPKAYLSLYKDVIFAFEDIATDLLTSYVIQKGEVKYRLTDIEFYLYHDGHKDIITYPRISPAGSCFFHSIGLMRKCTPMPTEVVAAAMIRLAKSGRKGNEIIVSQDILNIE